jgi:acetyl esterase
MHDKTNPSVSVKFKEVEGLSIYLDVYIPQNDVNELDVMFYIHGGAMVAMDRTDIPRWLPVKAQQYNSILISTDYRLAPQAKIPDSFQDIIDAFQYIYQT